jgi:MFS family permease
MKNTNMKFSLTLMFGLTLGCVMLDRQGVAYLFPALVKDFGLTNSQVGFISMVQTLAFAIASLFLSVLADKCGCGAVTPRIVGGLADSQGLPVVMLSAGFCMVAVILFSLFFVETSPR